MSKEFNADIEAWISKANHDLLVVERLISIEPVLLDSACFHCQQVIEKFLKCYLIFHGQNVGRTHNLTFLLSECEKYNKEFEEFDLRPFAIFAVDIRYPDSSIKPELDEVKEYYTIAVRIKQLVKNLISE